MPTDYLHDHPQFAHLIRIVAQEKGISPALVVEKLQTISTKFRLQQATKDRPIDFMRHYYDVYGLLQRPEVGAFIGTEAYKAHKAKRFRRADNQNIAQNEAFILSDEATRKAYAKAYADTSALYYDDPPTYDQILEEIAAWSARL